MSNCKNGHLITDERVLDRSSEIVWSVPGDTVTQGSQPLQDGQEETLPVRCENDEFDTQEFWNRAERHEIIVQAHPKHGKRIQTQRDTDVVHNARPEVARAETQISFLICVGSLHHNGNQRQNGFQPGILENAALDGKEGVWVGDIDLR